MPDQARELSLSNLQPAQARTERKRVGRGLGSGKGRYSGRGLKGQKARSGSRKMRAGFEGGQMPLHMRLGKQRGATSKDAMPIGPFMTRTQPINLRDLEARFEAGAEVTPEELKRVGLIKSTRIDVKILGVGKLTKTLSVSAHGFSASAREKIESAGGTVTWLRGDPATRGRKPKRRETAEVASAETTAAAEDKVGAPDESVDAEPEGAAEAAEGER